MPEGLNREEPIEVVYGSLRGPRRKENTPETKISTEKTMRECCSPERKPARSPLATRPPATRFTFPIMFTSLAYEMSAVMNARTRGMLVTMLVLMIVARIPEEIPLLEAGTDPMTELAFGLRNRPIPKPTRTRPAAICE